MKKKYDITASTGKYIKDGEEKTRYVNIGTAFERPDGSLCIKLETIPLEWNGWANFFEPRMKEDGYQAAKQAAAPADEMNDTIPF